MHCPVCKDAMLMMAERQGVEIDYCPKCRGVWLDRGELDKIIERAESAGSGPLSGGAPAPNVTPGQSAPPPPAHGGQRRLDDSDYGYTYIDPSGRPVHKKRKGLLRELFDFD
ncbi:MAG TPA: zf-TFIIB domain-containing protein [Phycisphaerales bacterium]|nr:zf-TFIIB domain-containing protein [Phycisphaerales bacterium]